MYWIRGGGVCGGVHGEGGVDQEGEVIGGHAVGFRALFSLGGAMDGRVWEGIDYPQVMLRAAAMRTMGWVAGMDGRYGVSGENICGCLV